MQIPLPNEENEKNALSYGRVIFKLCEITENHQKCEYNLKDPGANSSFQELQNDVEWTEWYFGDGEEAWKVFSHQKILNCFQLAEQ